MSLASLQALVDDLVRDKDQVIATADRDHAIAAAVLRYSQDRPRVLVVDVTSVSGGQRLPLPAGWLADFSVIQSVEHPIGNVPTSFLPIDEIGLYRGPTEVLIEVPVTLLAGDQVRVTFTGPHTVDGTAATPPAKHDYAIACWAAHMLCDQLANYYATSAEPSIQADTVNHQSKTQAFAARAKNYRARYLSELGLDEKRATPASAVVDLDLRHSSGESMMRRGRRAR